MNIKKILLILFTILITFLIILVFKYVFFFDTNNLGKDKILNFMNDNYLYCEWNTLKQEVFQMDDVNSITIKKY